MALIDRGADIDAKTNDGMTPLHWACEKGHTEVAMALMDT
jgi:ankyrin repeat protein